MFPLLLLRFAFPVTWLPQSRKESLFSSAPKTVLIYVKQFPVAHLMKLNEGLSSPTGAFPRSPPTEGCPGLPPGQGQPELLEEVVSFLRPWRSRMKRVILSCLAYLTALAKPLSVTSSRTGLLAENMPQRALFVFIELWKLTLF